MLPSFMYNVARKQNLLSCSYSNLFLIFGRQEPGISIPHGCLPSETHEPFTHPISEALGRTVSHQFFSPSAPIRAQLQETQ